jgi:hypothetical protein
MARRSSRHIRANHHLPVGGQLSVALESPISAYERYVYTIIANRKRGLPAPFVDLYLLDRTDGGRFALGFKKNGDVVLQTAGGRSFPVASVDVVSR